MPKFIWRAVFVLMAAAISCQAQELQPAQPEAASQAHKSGDYIRVQDSGDGDHVRLQVAIRSFEAAKGPKVCLVGAVHVGDKSYYEGLQKFLDQQDLVLFEGVKPGGAASDLANADDAAKAKLTKSRQRFLAVLVGKYKTEHGEYPENFDTLLNKLHGAMVRIGTAATKDGWGHDQQYKRTSGENGGSFDIVSLGSDGKAGGEGAAADLKFSDQKPLTPNELKGGGDGIQIQLAKALGLEFQLAAIDYDREKWRNSDLTIDQLESKLQEAGLSGSALFSLLDGSSLMSKFVGFLLGMMTSSPEGSLMMKTFMVEMLANTDEIMAAQGDAMGKGMGQFMTVLVVDRNSAVFADLDKVIKDEPQIKSVALFFGAGHLPDMEKRLEKMGYHLSGVEWRDAIDADLTKLPGGKAQGKKIRDWAAGMIDAQKRAKPGPAEDAHK